MFKTHYDEEAKLWSGENLPKEFDTSFSMGKVLLEKMNKFGPKIAQINADSGEKLTFTELRTLTIRAAQSLSARGYKANQVIGIMAGNTTYLSPIVFASFCLGCPVNSLSHLVERKDVIRMFGITEPSVVFCDVDVYDMIEGSLRELESTVTVFTFNGTKGDSLGVESLFVETGTEADFRPTQVDTLNDTIAIMSSSGTTGECKGVCLSHASLITQAAMFNVTTEDDIYFSSSSLNWMIGMIATLIGVFSGATRIITAESFSPEMQHRIVKDHKVTVVVGQSYYVVETLKRGPVSAADLSSLKHMVVAGYKLPLHVINEFSKYLENGSLNNSYGLTETSGFVTADFPEFSGTASVGQLISGYSLKIIDEEGIRCGINIDGEICIKTPYKFLGYYKNKNLTEKAFDKEGFILTGDIGHVDENGRLHIVDRIKDVIHYHYMVLPSEIEATLLKSPGIRGACVVGVALENGIELPAAVVVIEENSNLTKENVFEMVAEEMPDYCKLRGGVYFVDCIPTTSSGKILRRLAKETATLLYKSENVLF